MVCSEGAAQDSSHRGWSILFVIPLVCTRRNVSGSRPSRRRLSMGRRGTDAAEDTSDMILADDNYTTIVAAIRLPALVLDQEL